MKTWINMQIVVVVNVKKTFIYMGIIEIKQSTSLIQLFELFKSYKHA